MYTLSEHLSNLNKSIQNASSTNLKMNAVIIGSKCCEECDKINELKIPFEEVLENPILPYKKCTRKAFCICCYGFEYLRDENGVLIEKKY